MNAPVKITVYGEPVAQGRPKFARRGNFVTAYEPKKSRTFKSLVSEMAQLKKPEKLIESAVNMSVKIYRGVPKSWSGKKTTAALAGTIRPTGRPDLDNYIKLVSDAINAVILRDDSQVVSLDGSGKWYSETPRVEVIITEIGQSEATC